MKPIEISVREIAEAGLTTSDCRPIVFGENQPEYIPLPAILINGHHGQMVVKWRLSWRERFGVLFTGTLFQSQLTFNQPLQPIKNACTLRELFAARWQQPEHG